jgi:hypothetical protein
MKKLIVVGTLLMGSAPALLACAACFGKSDSAMARSLNASIFTLMGVVATVLAGAASFFVFLARRAATMAREQEASSLPPQPQS